MPTPEGRVLNAVCNYLALLEHQGHLMFWRQNNGATYDAKRGMYRKPGIGQRNGVPDVMVIMSGGKLLGVECKAGDGKQSTAQVAFQRSMEQFGASYAVVYNLDDLKSALAACGVPALSQPPAQASPRKPVRKLADILPHLV